MQSREASQHAFRSGDSKTLLASKARSTATVQPPMPGALGIGIDACELPACLPEFFLPACHCFIIISTKKILKTQGKAESHQLRPNKARSRSRRARWNPMKEVLVYITLSYKSKSPRSPKKRERKNKADGHTHARTQQHKCMVQAGSIKSIDQWVHGTPAGSIVVTANARPPHEISSMDHKPSVLKCVRSDVVLYILLRRGRRRQLR
jgi:hypothetical protein